MGKTSLIRKYIYDVFSDEYISTVGTKVSKKELEVRINKIDIKISLKLMIWDLMGQATYMSLHSKFYQGAAGALIVSDRTRPDNDLSFNKWIDSLHTVVAGVPVILLVNKSDLDVHPDFDQNKINSLAKSYDTLTFSTSAKTGLNVENAFVGLSKILIRKYIRKNY